MLLIHVGIGYGTRIPNEVRVVAESNTLDGLLECLREEMIEQAKASNAVLKQKLKEHAGEPICDFIDERLKSNARWMETLNSSPLVGTVQEDGTLWVNDEEPEMDYYAVIAN